MLKIILFSCVLILSIQTIFSDIRFESKIETQFKILQPNCPANILPEDAIENTDTRKRLLSNNFLFNIFKKNKKNKKKNKKNKKNKKGGEILNPGHILRYEVPDTFNYQGLINQKKNNNDQFLRSNIDNQANQRNAKNEPAIDMTPCRTIHFQQPPMQYQRGETVQLPVTWNNPHDSSCEVNIWTKKMTRVCPVVEPFHCGGGYKDQRYSVVIPKDVEGCETAADQCVIQFYGHSVETRTYAICIPFVLPKKQIEETEAPTETEEPTKKDENTEEPTKRDENTDEPTKRDENTDEPTNNNNTEEPTKRDENTDEPTNNNNTEEPTKRDENTEEPTKKDENTEEPTDNTKKPILCKLKLRGSKTRNKTNASKDVGSTETNPIYKRHLQAANLPSKAKCIERTPVYYWDSYDTSHVDSDYSGYRGQQEDKLLPHVKCAIELRSYIGNGGLVPLPEEAQIQKLRNKYKGDVEKAIKDAEAIAIKLNKAEQVKLNAGAPGGGKLCYEGAKYHIVNNPNCNREYTNTYVTNVPYCGLSKRWGLLMQRAGLTPYKPKRKDSMATPIDPIGQYKANGKPSQFPA